MIETPVEGWPIDVMAMQNCSRQTPGSLAHFAKFHPELQKQAVWNSEEMASRDHQYHWEFDRRFNELTKVLGPGDYQEVCAESWAWQDQLSPNYELWVDAFKSWRSSDGHWAVVSKQFKYVGAAIHQSKRGIWYSTVLLGTIDKEVG